MNTFEPEYLGYLFCFKNLNKGYLSSYFIPLQNDTGLEILKNVCLFNFGEIKLTLSNVITYYRYETFVNMTSITSPQNKYTVLKNLVIDSNRLKNKIRQTLNSPWTICSELELIVILEYEVPELFTELKKHVM
jgi:hypothetical protein